MPCYTVRLLSVTFKAQSKALLEDAARALRWNFVERGAVIQVGPVTVYMNEERAEARNQTDINTLKRAYSEAAVKKAASAKGWTLESWKDTTKGRSTIATKY